MSEESGPLTREPGFDLVGAERVCEVEALRHVAAQLAKTGSLGGRLDPLGHSLELNRAAELEDRLRRIFVQARRVLPD